MANTEHKAVIASMGESELRISIHVDHDVTFEGAAAQLQSEGLIPEDFEWPPANDHRRWKVNGFSYALWRNRPDGHKGPMRSWFELDNWVVRVSFLAHDYAWRDLRELDRQTEAMKKAFYLRTYAGRRELERKIDRYIEARSDKQFQAFKALIPGLIPAKRGRKSKATAQ